MNGSRSFAEGFPSHRPIGRGELSKFGMSPRVTERLFISTDSEGDQGKVIRYSEIQLFESKVLLQVEPSLVIACWRSHHILCHKLYSRPAEFFFFW